MSNLFTQFRRLLPSDPLLVGEVTAHNADGTSDLQLPGNQTIRVRGQGVAVGLKAFAQGGEIRGRAPDLPATTIFV